MNKFIEFLQDPDNILATLLWGLVLVLFSIIFIVIINLAQPKEFKGYYMCAYGGEHNIYINWDNRSDECAYRTYNQAEALRVYKELKELDKVEE